MTIGLIADAASLDVPIPPRYRWLKRTGLLLVILVPILGLVRVWWGRTASVAFDRAMLETRIAGIPTELHEFDPQPVPPEQNAALLLDRAADALTLTKEQMKLLGQHRIEVSDIERRSFLDATKETRGLVRQAQSLPGCDFGFRFRNLGNHMPKFSEYSHLGKATLLSARYMHELGESEEAITLLHESLFVARKLSEMGPLLSGLISIGLSEQVSSTIKEIGPDLVASTQVSPDHIRALIRDLANDNYVRESMTRGLAFERALQMRIFQETSPSNGALRTMFNRNWLTKYWHWLIRPVFLLDGAELMREESVPIIAAQQAHLPDAERILMAGPHMPSSFSIGRPLSGFIAPQFGLRIEENFEPRARQRLTATALAIWLYQREQGHWPERLKELVPDYIVRLPEDPMLEAGTVVRYISDSEYPLISCGKSTDRKRAKLTVRLKPKPSVTTRED